MFVFVVGCGCGVCGVGLLYGGCGGCGGECGDEEELWGDGCVALHGVLG